MCPVPAWVPMPAQVLTSAGWPGIVVVTRHNDVRGSRIRAGCRVAPCSIGLGCGSKHPPEGRKPMSRRRAPHAESPARTAAGRERGRRDQAVSAIRLRGAGYETPPRVALTRLRRLAAPRLPRHEAEVIHHGAFPRDGLRGHTDFLFRVDRESDLGPYSHEVTNTKLARRAKPYFTPAVLTYGSVSHLSHIAAAIPPLKPKPFVLSSRGSPFQLSSGNPSARRLRDLQVGVWNGGPLPVRRVLRVGDAGCVFGAELDD
jgi:hypothetical protein